jgi:iron(III) transport system ATP-binding protein
LTPALNLEGLRIAYSRAAGRPPAVDGATLALPAGEIGCLLGPSGCGKTSILRAIAGFEPLQAGRILLGGVVLASPEVHLPPENRRVGMMFQEGALFPHLDAAGNIGFGLRRLDRAARADRVAGLLDLVGLAGLGARYPHELSGGQQQRVALARALAPSPAVLLLDEPFSSLDPATRHRLGGDVRDIIRAAGQTAILVTHDEAEARALGDWIGVMREGRLQSWTPQRTTDASRAMPEADVEREFQQAT